VDAIRSEFVAAAGRWLAVWWQEWVETVVRTQHARTAELGKDELGSLKADVHKQIDSAEAAVE